MSKQLPWFRLYSEAVDDEKLRLLAFEDRWHFVALLCCKAKGILDETGPLLMRKVAVKLGLDMRTLEEVLRRLAEVGLIDQITMQPIAWESRQFTSDSSSERVKAYRERMKRSSNVPVTPQDTDTDTDTDTEAERERGEAAASAGAPPPSPPAAPPAAPTPPPAPKTVDMDGIPADLLADYMALRKAKKAGPLTKTAIAGLQREADKAGISLEAAVTACCEYGWQGFNASWYAERTAPVAQRKPAATETAYQRSQRERIEEVAPAIARKAPGAAPAMQATEFFNTVNIIDAQPLRIGSQP